MRVLPYSPYVSGLDRDAGDRVLRSLSRTSRGFDVDLVTPLLRDYDDPDAGRAALADELHDSIMFTGYPWLDEIENEQKEKIGAYSIMLPYLDRRDDVRKYFSQVGVTPDLENLRAAVAVVSHIMPEPGSLRLLSMSSAVREMPKGTNLGAPVFSADLDYLDIVVSLAQDAIQSDFVDVEDDPCLLYWRGQPRGLGEIPKQRVVWGYPHWITILELMIQEPLLKVLRSKPEFAAWNDSSVVDTVVTNIIDRARQDVLSVDFSGFDASVPGILIEQAFYLIRRSFTASASPLINFVMDRFLHIGLLTPEGVLIDRRGGVPSGSGLTNLIDSLVQLIIWVYVALVTGNPILDITVQGDDGVVSFSKPWDIQDVEGIIETDFGMIVSSDKGGISQSSVRFLQNIHSGDYRVAGKCVGIRPIMRALNGMLSYETLHSEKNWTGYADSIRWYQQAENCRFHPSVQALAQFLFQHDKYSRTLSAGQILDEAGGLSLVKALLKQASFPYGKQDLGGLANFTIVKLLRDLQQHSPMVKRRR